MSRILYTDNDPGHLEAGKKILEQSGEIVVDTAASVPEAARLMRTTTYDTIITGHNVPGLDGIALVRDIRSAGNSVPVILFSCSRDEDLAFSALNDGADFFLCKGCDPVARFSDLKPVIARMVMQNRMKREAANFEAFFNTIDDMVFVLDQDARIVHVNAAVIDRLGYTREELAGKEVLMLHPADRHPEARRILRDMIAGTTHSCPVPVMAKDGTLIEAETKVTRGMWDNHEVYIGVTRDVTERKQHEDLLTRSEELLRVVLNNANDEIFLLERVRDGPGRYILVNDTAVRMLGYSKYELMHMSPRDIVPPDVQQKIIPGIVRHLLDNRYAMFESVHRRKDGTTYPVEVGTYAFRFRGKDVDLSIARDITERKQAEEVIRQSRKELEDMITATADIIWKTDRDSRFIYISPQSEKILGYRPEELLGRTPFEFLDPGAVEANRAAFQAATATPGTPLTFTSLWLHKDGHQVNLESRALPVADECGSFAGFRGIDRDITDRARAEEALRQSEEKFRSLVEHGLEGIMILDFSGMILFANNEALKISGISGMESLIGRNVIEFIAPESRDAVMQDFSRVSESLDSFLAEYSIISPQQGKIDIECIGKKITYEGKPADLVVFRDITERKLARRALEESEERYRLIFETMEDLYYQTDAQGIITILSPSLMRLTGWTSDDLIGKPVSTVYVRQEDREGLLAEIMKNGYVRDYELVLKKRDGSNVPVSIAANMIRNPDGSFGGIAGLLRDITLRKEKDDALILAHRKLNLLSGIARHDIRNQIMALKAYLLLSRDALNDPVLLAEYIAWEQKIADTIERQIGFTKDYEEMAATPPCWQNLRDSAAGPLTLLPMQDIRLSITIPDIEIFADTLLDKVFYNLIDNALRYGGDGLSMIQLTSRETDGRLIVVFEDDGAGISPDEREMIFTRGFGKNTGLGLFLVREILGITGITITETGLPGTGARFEIVVPPGRWRMIRQMEKPG